MDWLTTFHLASVILDPYTNESSWILRTATRILEPFRGSDARINLIVTSGPADAQAFLGPLTENFLVFCDADRSVVKAIGLSELPAFGSSVSTASSRRAPGLEPAPMGRGRRCHRGDHVVVVDHGARPERPGRFPRFAGAWLSVAAERRGRASGLRVGRQTRGRSVAARDPSDVPRDLPIVDAIDDIREALRDHRRAIIVGAARRRQDHRRPARPARRAVGRRRSHRHARTPSPRHPCGGATHGRHHPRPGSAT